MSEGLVEATAPEEDGELPLGDRLRALRLLRRRTLKQVADAAAVSESFVSQVERGRASPSVATLQRLAAALGIEISDLFAAGGLPRPRVLRREARQSLLWGHLGRKALLTPKPFHSLEAVAAEFEPGGSTGDEPYTHGDSEELLLVIRGRARVQLGAELYELGAGDVVQYRSSTPHRVSNPGDELAEVVFVISPPSY
jgi:transcriptional regulator with XRE-family HTH domain